MANPSVNSWSCLTSHLISVNPILSLFLSPFCSPPIHVSVEQVIEPIFLKQLLDGSQNSTLRSQETLLLVGNVSEA